jgi:hypothetical protein
MKVFKFAPRAGLVVIALVAAMLVACAGPNPPMDPKKLQVSQGVRDLLESNNSLTLADPRIRCEQRRRVGSNFRTRVCMLKEEFEEQREDSLRDAYGAGQRKGGMGASGGGG